MLQPPDDLNLRNPAFIARSCSAESANSPSILAPMEQKASRAGAAESKVQNTQIPA
jgi:hypothetical protein